MKKIKKLHKIVGSAILSLLCAFSISSTSLAYNYTDYEFNDEGYIYVKENDPNAESHAVVYMYADTSDRNIKNINNHYGFDCVGGAVAEGDVITWLLYEFNPFNAKTYATLDNGEVWVWQFALENGEYKFSTPIGSVTTGSLPRCYTLNSSFEFPEYPEDYGPNYTGQIGEIISVENETIRLYVMYGNEEWREENKDAFEKWAMETEISFRGLEENQKDAQMSLEGVSKETITVEPVDSEIAIDTSTEPETQEVIEIPEAEEVPEDSSSGIKTIITGIGAVVIFAVLGFVFAKKKEE